jgi:hypothetical protein
VNDVVAPPECVGVYSYVTTVERVKIVRGAWICYQAQEFQDSILNGKISFVEGENGCPIKLLLATFPCASLKP